MKKPEEIIMAVLAALWVVLTYFILNYIHTDLVTMLTITGCTLLWCIVAFVFWQKNLMTWVWPVFVGLLIACWWPIFDWLYFHLNGIDTARINEVMMVEKTWYATWTFKLIIAIVPTLIAYVVAWKFAQKRKQKTLVVTPPSNPSPSA